MIKKIVAIGGGENGRIKSDGTKVPYETAKIDEEIIRLTEKKFPNFLLIAHSQPIEKQQGYFDCMNDIYGKRFGCECRDLKSDILNEKDKVKELMDWADIIYVGGGNTLTMINLWKETEFDKVLERAWEDGKVMCGVSAGANCWFSECSTDSLKILYGEDQPLSEMKCLGFIDVFFVPHCDEPGRYESAKELLKEKDKVGLLMSNCTALEIINDKYRLITSEVSSRNIKPYGLKTYWFLDEYIEEQLDVSADFKQLSTLLQLNDNKYKNI